MEYSVRGATLRYRSVIFKETAGLHISVTSTDPSQASSQRNNFALTYRLTLVINKLDPNNSTRPIHTSYADSVSITFSEGTTSNSRKILVTTGNRMNTLQAGPAKVDRCHAWFYIPLDGLQSISKSMFGIANYCTTQITDHHGKSLPEPNMQDKILVYVIRCIFNHLTPRGSLIIQDEEKKKFQAGYLRDSGRGKVWGLSQEGVWKEIL